MQPFLSLCEADVYDEGITPWPWSSEANPLRPAVKAIRGTDVRACLHLATGHALLKDFTLAKQEHTKK